MILASAVIVITSFCMVLWQAAFSADIPFQDVLRTLPQQSHSFNHNYISSEIGGYALQEIYYLTFLSSFVIILMIRMVFLRRLKGWMVREVLLLVVSLVAAVHFTFFLAGEARAYGVVVSLQGKTVEERTEAIFGRAYSSAKLWAGLVQGNHRAVLITDYNLDMTLPPYALGYYLYPALDVFVDQKSPIDYAVIFNKKDALQAVPDGFSPLHIVDDRNLLAVRADGGGQ